MVNLLSNDRRATVRHAHGRRSGDLRLGNELANIDKSFGVQATARGGLSDNPGVARQLGILAQLPPRKPHHRMPPPEARGGNFQPGGEMIAPREVGQLVRDDRLPRRVIKSRIKSRRPQQNGSRKGNDHRA